MRRSQIVALSSGTAVVVVAAAIAWHMQFFQHQAAPPVGTPSVTQPAPATSGAPAASPQAAPAAGQQAAAGARPQAAPAASPQAAPAAGQQAAAGARPQAAPVASSQAAPAASPQAAAGARPQAAPAASPQAAPAASQQAAPAASASTAPPPAAQSPPGSTASAPQTMADSEVIQPDDPIAPPVTDLTPTLPQFDTVRVEPTGDAVIAGHGQPEAQVALLANGNPIANVDADGAGNFVIIPTPLAPGSYELTLRSDRPGKPPRVSVQVVTVSVPARGHKNLVVAVAEPGKPTKVLADTAAPPPKAPAPTSPVTSSGETPSIAFKTAEVERDGFYASGTATPAGEHINLYLNDTHLAGLESAADDHWSVRVKRGLTPGHYRLRADALNATQNKVVARAEVAFDVPLLVADTESKPTLPATPAKAEASPPPPPSASVSAPQLPVAGVASSAPQPASDAKAPSTTPVAAAPAAPPAVAVSSSPPEQQASSEPPAPASTANDAVVPQVDTTTVVHGDSLWRISRKIFGHGIRYTVIYEANASQIRNPNLIYPGQVFVVPPNE